MKAQTLGAQKLVQRQPAALLQGRGGPGQLGQQGRDSCWCSSGCGVFSAAHLVQDFGVHFRPVPLRLVFWENYVTLLIWGSLFFS